MTHRYDLTETLHDFCDHAAEVVSATGAGVALLEGDKLWFVTATNPTVTAAEHAQEELQTGPCLASIHLREPVRVRDLGNVPTSGPSTAGGTPATASTPPSGSNRSRPRRHRRRVRVQRQRAGRDPAHDRSRSTTRWTAGW